MNEERWSKLPTFTVPILSKKSFQRPHPEENISTDPLHYHYHFLYVLLGNIRIRYGTFSVASPYPPISLFTFLKYLYTVKFKIKVDIIKVGTVRPD